MSFELVALHGYGGHEVANVLMNLFRFKLCCFRLRVFENRVLRRIFGPKRDGVTGDWRKLYNELNDLYSSHNIVRVIKPRRMRWAGHVARMEEGRVVNKVLVGKPEGKRPLGRKRRRRRIILRWIFGKWEGVVGT